MASFAEMAGSDAPEETEEKVVEISRSPAPPKRKRITPAERSAPAILEFASNRRSQEEIADEKREALRRLAPALASMAAMETGELVNIQGKGGKNLQMMLSLYAKSQGTTVGDLVPLACQEYLANRLAEL